MGHEERHIRQRRDTSYGSITRPGWIGTNNRPAQGSGNLQRADAGLISSLDQTIVSTALPTIVSDLGGLSQLSWVITGYLLASTVSTPLWGKLGDLYGRKPLFQASIVLFLAGSALCGLSQNMVELILFRAVQGLGAGGLSCSLILHGKRSEGLSAQWPRVCRPV